MSDRSRRRRPRRAHRMARKRRDVPLRAAIFSLLCGLIAIVGVLLVYKYKGEGPAEEVPRAKTVVTDTTSVVASDSSFSGALELRIYDALSELGIWADLIQIRSGAVDTVAAPREIRVRVPSDLALVLCNLEISRLVERLGGQVFEAIEYPRPREVMMKVGEGGRVTHRILQEEDSTRPSGRTDRTCTRRFRISQQTPDRAVLHHISAAYAGRVSPFRQFPGHCHARATERP